MGVSVYVMPLATWLAGDFRTTWGAGPGTASAPRARRSAGDALRLQDLFLSRLEPLLGRRPGWDDRVETPTATAFSAHAFSLPFLQARRWEYRLKLPQLSALEGPQIWIPAPFERVFRLESLWNDEDEVRVASLPGVRSELARMTQALGEEEAAEDWPELGDVARMATALLDLATAAALADTPVIVEG